MPSDTARFKRLPMGDIVWGVDPHLLASSQRTDVPERRRHVARQNLGHMAHLDGATLALQHACHIHQATQIAGEQGVGPGSSDMLQLLLGSST